MELSGTAKAAIFLLSLDEAKAIKIVEQFSEEELRQLRKAVDELRPITGETLNGVYQEFAQAFKDGLTTMHDGNRYLQELVQKARGEEEARRLFASEDELLALPAGEDAGEPGPLAGLGSVNPDSLQMALAEEHPQVAAAILAHLTPDLAATVLDGIEGETQIEILRRITTLGSVSGASFVDAQNALGGLDMGGAGGEEVDGIESAADILKSLGGSEATEMLDKLSMDYPTEAVKLRQAMFTFEDLAEADNRGLQALLREVQSDTQEVIRGNKR